MKSKWEVAGFCEDDEYQYDMLENSRRDLEELGYLTKIERNDHGYVLYVRSEEYGF